MSTVMKQAAWAPHETPAMAAFLDNLVTDCLKALRPRAIDWIALVAGSGRIGPMMWLLAHGTGEVPEHAGIFAAAAAAGQTPMLLFLQQSRAIPASWNEDTCASAARSGQLASLNFLRSRDPPCPWTPQCCSEASKNGHLHVVRWLHGRVPASFWTEACCVEAAVHGHLDVLKFLRGMRPPTPWPAAICSVATEHFQVEVLRWLLKQGCPWSATEAAQAPHMLAVLGDIQRMQRRPVGMRDLYAQCRLAARHGQLEMLRLLLACGGCSMQETPPHLIIELVRSWYCFKGLVRWAKKHGEPPAQWRGSQGGQRAQQAWQADTLRQYIALPLDIQKRIEAEALLSPAAAKGLS